jgi:lipoyl(octanoyl) transferase
VRVERLEAAATIPGPRGRRLVPYPAALAAMDALARRGPDADDLLLVVEHPPTITLGRRGGREHIHRAAVTDQGGALRPVEVHEVARGGAVTYHGPGQLVVYPIVRLARLPPPIGRPPLGDLPAFVRALEAAMGACCAAWALPTQTRPGFSGLWIDPRRKLASVGVGVRNGWTLHGLALNVTTRLDDFDAITPCALDGVGMTSVAAELERQGRRAPAFTDVAAVLIAELRRCLRG